MLSIVFFLEEWVPIAAPLPNVVITHADGRLLWLADYITGCNKWLLLTRLIIVALNRYAVDGGDAIALRFSDYLL